MIYLDLLRVSFVLGVVSSFTIYHPSSTRITHKKFETLRFVANTQQQQQEQNDNNNNNNNNKIIDRRSIIQKTPYLLLLPLLTTSSSPKPSQASYGADANIALPNIAATLSDRVNKQCLVESLGNRECLAYLDPEKKLYQSPDTQILLSRIEDASLALSTIPESVKEKNWSKVSGVLVGKMGTLVVTMDQLGKLSGDGGGGGGAKDRARRVKEDLYVISAAVDRKDGVKALEGYEMASGHLAEFVKGL